jgi:hypothetical protein
MRERSRRQCEDQYGRVCGIDLAVGRLRKEIGGQIGLRRIYSRLHVLSSAVNIPIQPELQDDTRLTCLALRRQFRHIGDLSKMPLKRLRQACRHDFRTGSRQLRLDHYGWEIDLRQRRHRQLDVAEDPRECDGDRQQCCGHRPLDEWS